MDTLTARPRASFLSVRACSSRRSPMSRPRRSTGWPRRCRRRTRSPPPKPSYTPSPTQPASSPVSATPSSSPTPASTHSRGEVPGPLTAAAAVPFVGWAAGGTKLSKSGKRIGEALGIGEKARFGWSDRVGKGAYRENFFDAYPDLKGKVWVHHAVEQDVIAKKYRDLGITPNEMHSLDNLRRIPKEINSRNVSSAPAVATEAHRQRREHHHRPRSHPSRGRWSAASTSIRQGAGPGWC